MGEVIQFPNKQIVVITAATNEGGYISYTLGHVNKQDLINAILQRTNQKLPVEAVHHGFVLEKDGNTYFLTNSGEKKATYIVY